MGLVCLEYFFVTLGFWGAGDYVNPTYAIVRVLVVWGSGGAFGVVDETTTVIDGIMGLVFALVVLYAYADLGSGVTVSVLVFGSV